MDNRGQDQITHAIHMCARCMEGQWVLLAARKALMIKDMSNNLYLFIKEDFSSCKSFEALHVKVYLGRKAMPKRPKNLSKYASFRHQPGDSGTIFAISPEKINTTGCLTFYIPKVSKREVNCTFSGPAEQKHDPPFSGC